MNRVAYEQLIAEDRAWLAQQPDSLERVHIDAVLRDSPTRYYAPAPDRALVEAAVAFLAKWDAAESAINGAFTLAHIHGFRYPPELSFAEELTALRAALPLARPTTP